MRGSEPVADFLSTHPKVKTCLYPTLKSHPQHALAKKQMSGGGSLICFDIEGEKQDAFAFVNALELILISNNLGDSKSLITHPASTTHHRLTPEARQDIAITDQTLRLSVGLEEPADIIADLERGFSALGVPTRGNH